MVTAESPLVESGKGADFRDEYNINSRGPVRLRPQSNQLREQNAYNMGGPMNEMMLPPSLS